MYQPKYFELYELLSEPDYQLHGHRTAVCWGLFDERLLKTLDLLRLKYGPMTMNNWYWGGSLNWRGFRGSGCTVGTDLSQHRFGRGADSHSKRVSAKEIREDIKENRYPETFQYITCIEDDVFWLHFDVRNTKQLLVV